ncbi:apolipoprotein N-acyltransferase [Sphingobacteriales bacterium UPWRP_1]|nr:apolipoprotein N-acyltransferase [Sphingobacteriales bacterium TSM_CSS]PSJ78905.1 apolipoprotein N-acyltransferase [Sphingobacteriales bacterium UPWRP_1]
MPKHNLWLLPLCAALLCRLAWIPLPFTPLLFFAFVPMLLLEQQVADNRQWWRASVLFFLLWNVFTTWWIVNSTIVGAVFAFLANALLMSIPFMLFRATRLKLGNRVGYLSFLVYWLAFEFLHQRWELAWPWLNLGNALAPLPQCIQWFEYTGSGGGTLWVLGVNLAVFGALQPRLFPATSGIDKPRNRQLVKSIALPVALFLLPVLASLYLFYTYTEKGQEVEIALVQPSEDPYFMPDEAQANQQVATLLSLSEKAVTPNTRYLVFPEAALPDAIWLNDFTQQPRINQLRQWLHQYPNLKLVSGFTALQHYNQPYASATARPYLQRPGSYDVFNSSFQIDTSANWQVYHKSKLVPGVEKIPYQQLFGVLTPLISELGGGIGSFGEQPHRTVFFGTDSLGIAPVICYESVFGQYLTDYIKQGAQLIFIMTNDGWWGNTDGYRQHLHYASLRAIETRRSIARAANTGISCFIDQRGLLHTPLAWQQRGAQTGKIRANTTLTIYTIYGDFIGRTSLLLAGMLILLTFVSRFTPHFANKIR